MPVLSKRSEANCRRAFPFAFVLAPTGSDFGRRPRPVQLGWYCSEVIKISPCDLPIEMKTPSSTCRASHLC
jgi:hypothetical protein